jgi:hypothetical protein
MKATNVRKNRQKGTLVSLSQPSLWVDQHLATWQDPYLQWHRWNCRGSRLLH